MQVAVVIPVYNNPDTILEVALACRKIIQTVLVVDDASTSLPKNFDNILAANDIQLERHDVNSGYGAAIMTGIRRLAANGFDYAVTLDADAQHSPDDIPAFVETIEHSCQSRDAVIVGVRDFSSPNIPKASKFGRSFSNFWVKLETGISCADTQSGFRAYPVEAMAKLRCISTGYPFAVESLVRSFWGGVKLLELSIHVTYQTGGKYVSHFRPLKDNARFALLHTWLVTRRLLPWPVKRVVAAKPEPSYPNPFRHPVLFLQSLLKENTTPQMLAISAAVSTFLAVLPLLACHIAVILYVSIRLKLNKVMALAIQNLYMPPVTPFLCIELGFLLRNGHFLREASMRTIVPEFHVRLLDWLVGSLVLAPVFAVVAGIVTYIIASCLKRRQEAR